MFSNIVCCKAVESVCMLGKGLELLVYSANNLSGGRVYNLTLYSFQHTDSFWRLCTRQLLKTLGQKEKLLMMGNFPFSTMFSTPWINSILIDRDIHIFSFKVVWWRFVVCRKILKLPLKESTIIKLSFEQFLLLSPCFQKAVCCRGVYMRERIIQNVFNP